MMKYNISEEDYEINQTPKEQKTKAATTEPAKDEAPAPAPKSAPTPAPQKESRVGRPSKNAFRTSIAVEGDLLAVIDAGAGCKYKGNKSAYINALIRKDYEENKSIYDEFIKLMR